jgi:hypothetical protein
LTDSNFDIIEFEDVIDLANKYIPDDKKIDRDVELVTEYIRARVDNCYVSLRHTVDKGVYMFLPKEKVEIIIGKVPHMISLSTYNSFVLSRIGDK